MNLPLIETFKTVTVSHQLAAANTFSTDIYVDFIPDEIVLKNISIYDADTTTTTANKDKMFLLKSSLISENSNILATYPLATAFHESYHIPFRCGRPIGGSYSFSITDIDGAPPAGGANYDTFASVTLLFIKYKK